MRAGIADPALLSLDLDTDTFLSISVKRWAESRIYSEDIRSAISLDCEITQDYLRSSGSLVRESVVSISVTTNCYLEWEIGPFIEGIASRDARVAKTLLHIIEECLYYETFGPRRAHEWREHMEEMETEIVEDDGDDEEAEDRRQAEVPYAPPFSYLTDVKPIAEAHATEPLRACLDGDTHQAVEQLIRATTTFHRLIANTQPEDREFSVPAMLQIFETRGDAIQQAFEDEAQCWASDTGPSYSFCCAPSDAKQVGRCFRTMEGLLRVYDALGNLRSLTNTTEAST